MTEEHKFVYKRLPTITPMAAQKILEKGDVEELMILPLSLGMYLPTWEGSQRICLQLMKHEDVRVCVNAAQGLSYICLFGGEIDKRLAKPALLDLLASCQGYEVGRVVDAIESINRSTGWKIASKHIEKMGEG